MAKKENSKIWVFAPFPVHVDKDTDRETIKKKSIRGLIICLAVLAIIALAIIFELR